MRQIHTRFTADQVKALLKGYEEGNLDRLTIEEMLEIGRSRYFALLKEYRENEVIAKFVDCRNPVLENEYLEKRIAEIVQLETFPAYCGSH
ncbi:MAG: hypothetical protein M1358_14360 [Chloroflexi bacterium]|nr:hypothetical protein [Chloroflexota bacterium]